MAPMVTKTRAKVPVNCRLCIEFHTEDTVNNINISEAERIKHALNRLSSANASFWQAAPAPILSSQISKPGCGELQRLRPSRVTRYAIHPYKIMNGIWLCVHKNVDTVLFHLGRYLSTFLVERVTFANRDECLGIRRECTGRRPVWKSMSRLVEFGGVESTTYWRI